jgi:hypothetical protein
VSSLESEDFGDDLLAAKERDLKPLLEESGAVLDLDHERAEAMADLLNLAWFSGIRSGQARMQARATEREPDVRAVAVRHFEADFRALMECSADTLDLGLPDTIQMWDLLQRAWVAGNRTCEAELFGLYLKTQSDVGKEALDWLEDKSRGDGDDPRS